MYVADSLFVQATFVAVAVVIEPLAAIVNLVIVHTADDSAEPVTAYPL